MKKRKISSKFLLLLCLLIAISNCENTSSPYEAYFEEVKNLGFSGEVILSQAGEIIFKNSSHDFKTGSDLFYIASISKTFTAIAIVKLAQTGRLNIDARITDYLTEVPNSLKTITIQHLLSHTSGIGSFGWNPASNDWHIMTKEQAVKGILNQRLTAPVGKGFNYNNANYILLSAIVESITGITFQQYLRTEILEPVNLLNTHFGIELEGENLKVRDNFDYDRKLQNYSKRPKSWLRVGGGDMISSIDDLIRFIDLLSQGKIVNKEWVEKILVPLFEIEPNHGYGYGWHIRFGGNGRMVLFHSGSFGGYNSECRWYPHNQKSLVIFSNNSHPSSALEKISNKFVSLTPDDKKADNTGHMPLPRVLQQNLIGHYANSNMGAIEVKEEKGNTLLFLAESKLRSKLRASDYSDLLIGSDSLTKSFLSELKRDIIKTFSRVLPLEELEYLPEYVSEWRNTIPMGQFEITKIESVQLSESITRSYVTISTEGQTYHYALTWEYHKLIGTVPNGTIAPIVLNLVTNNDKLFAYSWDTDQFLECSFINKPDERSISIRFEDSQVSFYSQ